MPLQLNTPLYLIIHHAGGSDANPLQDSSNLTFEACNNLHRNNPNVNLGYPSSLGFYIGYHYYIEKNGVVKQGRLDTDEGAHCKGKNTSSIGICLAGNFDATLPTPAQEKALQGLLRTLAAKYGIKPENIVPHRAFAGKTCYGRKLPDDWARKLAAMPVSVPVINVKDEIKKHLTAIETLLTKL